MVPMKKMDLPSLTDSISKKKIYEYKIYYEFFESDYFTKSP